MVEITPVEEKEKESKFLPCSKCGTNQFYTRIKSKERVCKKCGNVEKIEEVKD